MCSWPGLLGRGGRRSTAALLGPTMQHSPTHPHHPLLYFLLCSRPFSSPFAPFPHPPQILHTCTPACLCLCLLYTHTYAHTTLFLFGYFPMLFLTLFCMAFYGMRQTWRTAFCRGMAGIIRQGGALHTGGTVSDTLPLLILLSLLYLCAQVILTLPYCPACPSTYLLPRAWQPFYYIPPYLSAFFLWFLPTLPHGFHPCGALLLPLAPRTRLPSFPTTAYCHCLLVCFAALTWFHSPTVSHPALPTSAQHTFPLPMPTILRDDAGTFLFCVMEAALHLLVPSHRPCGTFPPTGVLLPLLPSNTTSLPPASPSLTALAHAPTLCTYVYSYACPLLKLRALVVSSPYHSCLPPGISSRLLCVKMGLPAGT